MWRKLQPAWDPVTAGSVASFPSLESKSAESTFNQTGWEFSWPCLFFYWKIITWNPDQVSVVMLKKPQWHQSIRLSVFSIRALKALLTSAIKPFQLNDRNPLFTVQFYTHATMSNFFQNFKEYRNLNRSKANCPELLCPQLFKMTTSETSRRWRV